ncbi:MULTISPECIES: nucleoside hydrolase [unclassified Enterococcus]|uniref:nucleoside hydrolase n=1 Tax=unclassified Enterococcus TaxID=2608891 RepID=UPI001CE16CFB|nr:MULTISPECIES: nucleoside hydrolase [unclassified Enterococcus]MCA5011804.1 nucleoside hydrolase [Enterococcus sp. S23]MCA5014754.1 nucleoside hydrolase [Enterococcus sp. S22(2020)]
MAKQKIILDCDPGHDDALALLMALASDKVELIGITTSAGNQLPEKTFDNTRKLLALANREDIPVAMGALKPLRRELIIADDVHGESGLDGAELPEPTAVAEKISGNDLLAKLLRESDEKVTIIATGPLTNIAIFLLSHPELKEKIELISFMGGACFGGNITPHAEFNIYVDPEAADIVVKSGVPTAMFGLDVTLKAQLFEEDIQEIRAIGNPVARTMADLLDFFNLTTTVPFLAEEGHIEGIHMHDPCAMAYVIDPSLFKVLPMHVEVETSETLALGSTVVDYDDLFKKEKNVLVGFDIDLPKFKALVIDTMSYFSK